MVAMMILRSGAWPTVQTSEKQNHEELEAGRFGSSPGNLRFHSLPSSSSWF
jgi:hypothetical protein